jgi:glycosyltransferase involved in cell wall biosynthesis
MQDYFGKYEIIISDDSKDYSIYQWILEFNLQNALPNSLIKYFHNGSRGKSSINMNNAISKSEGDIIKPMFCDDYFIYSYTMNRFVKSLNGKDWAFCRSEHRESGRITHNPYPNFDLFSHDKGLAEGCNTYGCPSAMAFRKTDITFDENLIWLMDCEFYTRMQLKYGEPAFVDTAINVREWEGQQSKTACNGNVRLWEREYVINKFKNA